ncbi:MAG: SDR family NAD(P)-dependent oxidoreductase [Chloroflexi bacterium]|nr:SDR family NAD(P)-dependent oxidoreductase [Chloroflexota bacterium]
MHEAEGRTALITGASSGIGAAFARQLAAAGWRLLLVARRQGVLATLAAELQAGHGVQAEAFPADLAAPHDLARLEAYIGSLPRLDLLINNAGFGSSGHLAENDPAVAADMVAVHATATARLCRAALPGMLARGQGSIINTGSIAAFLPVTGNVLYSASKMFVVRFSQSLALEVGGQGIRVQALCPGFTLSGFHDTPVFADFDRRHIPAFLWNTADEVAAASLAALQRGRPVVFIPYWKNRLIVFLSSNGVAAPTVRLVRGLLRRRGRRRQGAAT